MVAGRLIVDMSGSAVSHHEAELRELRRELGRLRAENARLARLVGLVGPRPLPDEAARSPLFGGLPGAVNRSSSKADKVTFFRHLFAGHAQPASGSIGNLIALPLQGKCRKQGATVFLDLATLEPHEDQFGYLSHVECLTPKQVADRAEAMRPLTVGPGARRLHASGATRMHPPAPAVIRARLGAGVSLERAGLPPALLRSLEHAASLHNPEFYKREKRRLSTYGVPRFVRCYHEDLEWLHLPRGLREVVQDLVLQAVSRLEITDDRPERPLHDFSFNAQLLPAQQRALDAILEHELGVLVAPPGAGKTVVGCAPIAKTGLPTLVLVDRTALLDQWRGQVETLLGVKPGQLGGGRRRRSGLVDLASLQTLARRDDLAELLADYGLVIADECHHLPAATLERAVRQLPTRRWLGLTATPYRRRSSFPAQWGPERAEHVAAPTVGGLARLRPGALHP